MSNFTIKVEGDASKWLNGYWMTGIANMEKIAINRVAPAMERYAKTNAPWTDRTGQARARLSAKYERTSDATFDVSLSHGVPYGVHLEYRDSGRYAILRPTLNALFPSIANDYMEAWR